MKDNHFVLESLEKLGLTEVEVRVYLSLLKGAKNHLAISRDTNIARSNVYRLVDGLIEKGIVHELTTDDNEVLESSNPAALELLVLQQEIEAQQKRNLLTDLLPTLQGFANQDGAFAIKNYTGLSGLKQMLWNELSTKSEICIFSCGNMDEALGKNFAEKLRLEVITRGIVQRGLENTKSKKLTISSHSEYSKHYQLRFIDPDILPIMPEISIHDDTVSIYNNWAEETKLGTEIKNPYLAAFMKQIFEHYWGIAQTEN